MEAITRTKRYDKASKVTQRKKRGNCGGPLSTLDERRGEWTVEQGQSVMVKNQVIQSKK